MRFLNFYKDKLNLHDKDEVFNFLIDNLQKSIADWSFFVDWKKINKNIGQVETELNILNSLLGKEQLEDKFINIIQEYPKIKGVLPLLIATRQSKLIEMPILDGKDVLDLESKEYLFKIDDKLDEKSKNELIRFFNESGLKKIFEDRSIKNLVDYCFGIEVGMDTNARKNRGGHNMEKIVEEFISKLCKKQNLRYLKEVNAEKIKKEFGYDVPVDKSSRRYDFVIDNGEELFIIETNFYGGGGSKLKATAGEYRTLFDVLEGKYTFIWITDGFGWQKTTKPLRETFNHNDYVFNLAMINQGIFEHIIK